MDEAWPVVARPPGRILVIRLDRIGDVVLSTPVLQALRLAYPHAFIAMMVRSACRSVVEGHPHLDELILYDKERAHRSVRATVRFARRLRRHEFDTALVLHPSRRSHWIPWLAGIPVRIGYDRKGAWLLTHRIRHRKQEGRKHEADYTVDCLRVFGLEPPAPRPLVPVGEDARQRVACLLQQHGIGPAERLIALHPSASCVSKRWPAQRFAALGDRLIGSSRSRVVLVAGPEDVPHAQAVQGAMRQRPVDLSGQLSLAELIALLQRCRVLVSNDSGPVHLAAAVGTPTVVIFGRNQQGLSPQRWGPLGQGHVVLHKEVGCVTCLAHECDIGFLCLTSLSVEEVLQAVERLLEQPPPHP